MKITAFKVSGQKVTALEANFTKGDLVKLTAAVALTMSILMDPANVMAATTDPVSITEKVAKATQPIKDMLLGIADPVCYIACVWGVIELMIGKGSSGLNKIKYALLGYIGLNWLPVLMEMARAAKP